MGHQRPRPRRLAYKLRRIRLKMALTQIEMAELVRHNKSPVYPGHVSEFETGRREPSILVLLQYARTAGVALDSLIDDEMDLPN
jgi:transcriptional regulator with XRE-family HTH domain